MTKNGKKWATIILVIVCVIVLFRFVVPAIFEWALMSDVKETSQRNAEYQNRRTELYPKITKKLELLKDGKIQLSNEEAEKLVTIRSGLIENPKEWLMSEFKGMLETNNERFQSFLKGNPEEAKIINSWIQGETAITDENLRYLMDSYYGYIANME